MKKTIISVIFSILLVAMFFSGCISGGDDNAEADTTTAPPTTTAPTNPSTTAAPTQPPTTAPATPAYVHSGCSTLYVNQDPGNARYYACDISASPEDVWSLDIGRPLSHILADYDRIFYIEFISNSYMLKCLDVNSGDLYWETSLPFLGFYDLILQDEKLYVFQNAGEKTLICYDAHDGSMLWTSEDVYDIYPDVGELIADSMTCADGKVFVTLGESGSDTVILCCFDAATGETLWHNNNDYSNRSIYPSFEGGVLYYSVLLWEENDQIIGLDVDTGDVTYVYNTPLLDNFNGRDIVVSDGRIYAMAQNMDTYELCIACISIVSNDIVWQHDIGDYWGEDIIVGDDYVFVTKPEEIICLDKGDGQEMWNIPMDYHLWDPAIATPGKLMVFRSHYLTEVPPQMLMIDSSSGEELWSVTLEGTDLSNCASFYDDKILVATDNGKLYCFE